MYLFLLFLIALLRLTPSAQSASDVTIQILEKETGEPLAAATIYIQELERGVVADSEGIVFLTGLPDGVFSLEIRHIGFESELYLLEVPYVGKQPIQIYLDHEHGHLEEITVSTTRMVRGIENAPTRVEALPLEEIEEKINMRPGDIRMLLAESTGIQVQQTSPVTGNANFRIQGLDGRYTQLLKDGFPLYSGFSGGLSIMQVPPLDLYQVEVIKGSSSTLYGGGAIAGLVNLISKRPQPQPELSFLANVSSNRNLDFSGYYSDQFKRLGVIFFGTFNQNPGYDPSDQEFSAIPQYDRLTLNPKIFWEPTEQTHLMGALQFVSENRLGGDMDYLDGSDPEGRFFEEHKSTRLSTQFSVEHQFSPHTQLTAKTSLTLFDRSIEVPEYLFQGVQTASFSELSLAYESWVGNWVGGVNFWSDHFNDQTPGLDNSRDFTTHIYGSFLQHTYEWTGNFTTETGMRADFASPAPASTRQGLFLLPRLSMYYRFNEQWSMRLSGGMGYKMPDMFIEDAENRAFRDVLQPDFSNIKPERSKGVNADVNFRTILFNQISFTWNQLVFFTHLDDPLFLEATGQNTFRFTNLDGFVNSRGTESNISFIYNALKLFLGYTFVDANQHSGESVNQVSLNSPHQVNAILMMEEHGSYRIGLEGYYYSPQKLTDGTTSRGYTIFGIMGEKKLGKITVFANLENMFDTRQTRFGPIYTDTRENPIFNDIYAPLEGRYVNLGMKLSL